MRTWNSFYFRLGTWIFLLFFYILAFIVHLFQSEAANLTYLKIILYFKQNEADRALDFTRLGTEALFKKGPIEFPIGMESK